MFWIFKEGELLYKVEEKVTKAQLEEIWWDECREIIEEERIPTSKEIGEKITEDVFWGNPYTQLADMVKAQVITLALLVPVFWKETVKVAYADLLATVQKVSESRVSQGLSPYDLSFLD